MATGTDLMMPVTPIQSASGRDAGQASSSGCTRDRSAHWSAAQRTLAATRSTRRGETAATADVNVDEMAQSPVGRCSAAVDMLLSSERGMFIGWATKPAVARDPDSSRKYQKTGLEPELSPNKSWRHSYELMRGLQAANDCFRTVACCPSI